MKSAAAFLLALAAGLAVRADGVLDAVDDALSASALHDRLRARLSGTLDVEGYHYQQPAPSLIDSRSDNLLNPRLTLFLDAQLGPRLYAFAESRLDRGFDPGDEHTEGRLDEYALRLTPWDDGRFSLQAGKFATIVGNWTTRHDSWDNPLVTAPLPYENLTGIWDIEAARSAGVIVLWANAGARPSATFPIKARSVPVIWGPSYATGASASGRVGSLEYAVEVKNASLSSRPETWNSGSTGWRHPTASARVGFAPDPMWDFGFSASSGSYLKPIATASLAAGSGLGDYREIVLGQDAAFAWHHWQVWAEAYEARFQVPRVGNADTVSCYVEAKLKVTPRLFLAARWNRQVFSDLPQGAGEVRWGSDVWRVDFGPGFRLTARAQAKLQYSVQRQDSGLRRTGGLLAGQFTVRF